MLRIPFGLPFESGNNTLNPSGVGKAPLCLSSLVGGVVKQGLKSCVFRCVRGGDVKVGGCGALDNLRGTMTLKTFFVAVGKVKTIAETPFNRP